MTLRTYARGEKLRRPLLARGGFVIAHHVGEIFDNSIEGDKIIARSVHYALVDANSLQRTIHHFVDSLAGYILIWSLEVATVFLENGIYLPEYHLVLVFTQRSYGPVVNAKVLVGYHFLQVDLVHYAQPVASGASPLGRVERKHVWRWVTIGKSCTGVH